MGIHGKECFDCQEQSCPVEEPHCHCPIPMPRFQSLRDDLQEQDSINFAPRRENEPFPPFRGSIRGPERSVAFAPVHEDIEPVGKGKGRATSKAGTPGEIVETGEGSSRMLGRIASGAQSLRKGKTMPANVPRRTNDSSSREDTAASGRMGVAASGTTLSFPTPSRGVWTRSPSGAWSLEAGDRHSRPTSELEAPPPSPNPDTIHGPPESIDARISQGQGQAQPNGNPRWPGWLFRTRRSRSHNTSTPRTHSANDVPLQPQQEMGTTGDNGLSNVENKEGDHLKTVNEVVNPRNATPGYDAEGETRGRRHWIRRIIRRFFARRLRKSRSKPGISNPVTRP